MFHSSWRRKVRRFEQAALPHLASVYRIARRMAGSEAAEDLAQETFLRAWRYFDTFDPDSNCRAWLLRILRNAWADRWRRPRLEIPISENEDGGLEPYYEWEEEFLAQELSGVTEQALAQLPAEYRWAVLLADVEEFSYQEIAEILGCPIGTVMSRINRGRRALARFLRARANGRQRSRQPAKESSEEQR